MYTPMYKYCKQIITVIQQFLFYSHNVDIMSNNDGQI